MSGSFETDAHESPYLARLSAAERGVLELLAQGHTAKSIAGLTGQSEGAINERLRSARRKTGVGSSRELARLVGAQKNRAENIGMSLAEPPVAVERAQARPNRARPALSKGLLLMLLTFSAAAIALLLQTTSPTSSGGPPFPDDPLIGSAFPEEQVNFHSLHQQVRSEPRAADWAAPTEAALRRAYDRAAEAARKSELRVICGSSLCEAAGVISGDFSQISAVEKALQEPTEGRGRKSGVERRGREFRFAARPLRSIGVRRLLETARRVRRPGAAVPRRPLPTKRASARLT